MRVVHCPFFDIATQGETPEQAERNFAELLELFLESCERRGTLEEVLREAMEGQRKRRVNASFGSSIREGALVPPCLLMPASIVRHSAPFSRRE